MTEPHFVNSYGMKVCLVLTHVETLYQVLQDVKEPNTAMPFVMCTSKSAHLEPAKPERLTHLDQRPAHTYLAANHYPHASPDNTIRQPAQVDHCLESVTHNQGLRAQGLGMRRAQGIGCSGADRHVADLAAMLCLMCWPFCS